MQVGTMLVPQAGTHPCIKCCHKILVGLWPVKIQNVGEWENYITDTESRTQSIK